MNRTLDLTKGPVRPLIAKVALPASMGFFFHTMFNVTDTWFAGMVSTQSLAAMALSFPIYLMIISAGHGLGTGVTALMGTDLGAGDRKNSAILGVQGLSFGLLASVLVTFAGIYGAPAALSLLGASGAYLEEALSYTGVIFLGSVFFIANYVLNAILNAQGDTKSFRNFLIAGFFLNCALDPWFVLGGLGLPKMGLFGVGLATVVIEAMGTVYLGFRVKKTGLLTICRPTDLLPRARPFYAISVQGFPAGLSFVTMAAGVFVIQYFVAWFGKEAIAAYGIGMRIEQIVLIPTIGLNTAALAMVAQNAGAGRFDRVSEVLNKCLLYGAVLMALGGVLVYFLARPLMGLFTQDPGVVETGAEYLRIDALVFYAYVALYTNISALQGLKRPWFALFMGLFRQLAAPVCVFYLFVRVLDMGLTGVWWGIFFVTWTGALISLAYARMAIRQEKRKRK